MSILHPVPNDSTLTRVVISRLELSKVGPGPPGLWLPTQGLLYCVGCSGGEGRGRCSQQAGAGAQD